MAVAGLTGWACSRHGRTRRFASAGRPCLPGELRRPPFRKPACSVESCLPAGVRLRLCARVPVLGSRFFLLYGEDSPLCSPSRQIKAEEGDAFQACLEKRPIPEAAPGDRVAKARRSRGSGGGVTNKSRPTPPRQHSRVLAFIRGKNQERFPASHTPTASVCPPAADDREPTSL
jgi:hypothetical protein